MKDRENDERKGQYSAERLKQQSARKYLAIIKLRGLGWSHRRIAEFLGLHHRTIVAVDDVETKAIDTLRQRLIKKLWRAADQQLGNRKRGK